jgi:triosephosphate isomerase
MRFLLNSTNTPILLTQCKAYYSLEEISKAIDNLIEIQSTRLNIHISLPYAFMEPMLKIFTNKGIHIGAEILLNADEGTFTASIVGKMLEASKATFALIGTSQDRTSHSSSPHHLTNKVKEALKAKVTPFICIGDTLQEHQDKVAKQVLTTQLKDCLDGISNEEIENIYIVYNAEWISRTPWEATSQNLQEAYQIFREVVNEYVEPESKVHDQLIVAVPAYSEDVSALIKSLQMASHAFSGYSVGLLGLSSAFLQPLEIV